MFGLENLFKEKDMYSYLFIVRRLADICPTYVGQGLSFCHVLKGHFYFGYRSVPLMGPTATK